MAADQTTAEQKRLFTEAMVKKISKQGDERSQFLTEARYNDICAALDGWTGKDGPAKKETQQNFTQVYAWVPSGPGWNETAQWVARSGIARRHFVGSERSTAFQAHLRRSTSISAISRIIG